MAVNQNQKFQKGKHSKDTQEQEVQQGALHGDDRDSRPERKERSSKTKAVDSELAGQDDFEQYGDDVTLQDDEVTLRDGRVQARPLYPHGMPLSELHAEEYTAATEEQSGSRLDEARNQTGWDPSV